MQKRWQVAGGLAVVKNIEDLRSLLLKLRGVEGDSATAFFEPDYQRDIHDPLAMHDMQKAVDRIFMAIKKKESIIVHGDYDADGITSTAILVTTLQDLGAQVTPFLPSRTDDGYGLSKKNLEQLESEMDLLISVDCGISNFEEIKWLKSKKIDSIIVDHHEFPERLPPALAIIHPNHPKANYPWPHLCGAGTAWKLASTLLRDNRSGQSDDIDAEKWLLDLAALGTIADMVSLQGENRAIASFGMEIIKRTKRPGLQALLVAGRSEQSQLTSDDVAFEIIPALNAAGRLDHPMPALELLLTDDVERAQELRKQLTNLNNRRRTLTKKIVDEAQAQVNGDAVIFAYNSSWPAGLVGLVAGRLSDKWQRPAVVVGGGSGGAVGSARAPASVNILNILRQAEGTLTKLGGHAQAAGFSLHENNIGAFREEILANVDTDEKSTQEVASKIDAIINSNLLTAKTAALLESFAPFGEGNKRPQLAINNLQLVDWRVVGKTGEHAKFTFDSGDIVIDGIGFGLAEDADNINSPEVSVVAELVEDEWRGNRRLQLLVREIVDAGSVRITA